MKSKSPAVPESLKISCRVLDEKKASKVVVLDVSEQSSITDFLVVATATSLPHLRALRVELEKALDAANTHLVGMEPGEESGWLVIDAFDFMIHIFLEEPRERYGLERLWRDSTEISVDKILKKPKATPKTPHRKTSAPRRPRAK